MFLSEFKKILGRAVIFSLSLYLFSGAASAEDINEQNESRSKVYSHNKSSGGSSRDTIVLTGPKKMPDGSCALFVKAKIIYNNQRFVSAKITSRPKKHCKAESGACKVVVEADYAPVGRLSYWVKSKWKVQSSGC